MAEQQKPGFFARICCCSRNDKEPTVTLIRSNDLPNAPQSSISPAKETVDGFEDQALEVPKDESGPKEIFRGAAPKWKVENKEEQGVDEIKESDMNINDVIIEDVCGEEEEKPNVEDAVSIRTNVVEEVDESELRQMSEILKKDEEVSPQTTSRSGEIVTLKQMLVDGYESPRLAEETKPAIEVTPVEEPRDKQKEEKEFKEMQDITQRQPSAESGDDSELEEEVIMHDTPRSAAPTASPRSILKTSSSNPSTGRTVDSEERALSPPQEPLSPPPETEILEGLHHAVMVNLEEEQKKPSSMMYADAETDSDDSDDAAEALPPVAKPEDDETDLDETDDEEKSEKENRVTRLSVKSNGQATMTTGNVRVALEAVEITDDEFSEKLI